MTKHIIGVAHHDFPRFQQEMNKEIKKIEQDGGAVDDIRLDFSQSDRGNFSAMIVFDQPIANTAMTAPPTGIANESDIR
jgi:hypothetical protein